MNVQDETKISELDDLSERIYQSASNKNYATSNELLRNFEEDYTKLQQSEEALGHSDAVTVVSSIKQTEQSIKKLEKSKATASDINDITSFRFLVDALLENDEPLWATMQPQMVETILKVDLAVQNNDYENYNRYLSDFFTQYDVIYDSLKVDISSGALTVLDENVEMLKENREEIFASEDANDQLIQVHTELKQLLNFIVVEHDTTSNWWVFAMIFSFIIATLTYVGWRKYSYHGVV